MDEPDTILSVYTRIRTNSPLASTGGFLIAEKHLALRKPGVIGVIMGIVGGHGGDVYWVAHIGDPNRSAYGWMDFELEPAQDPCPECKGTGIDWDTSARLNLCKACSTCGGTAERRPPPVSVYEHLKRSIET